MGAKDAQPPGGRRWDGVLRRSVDITTRAVDEESRSVEVIASTETLDSHGDILEQDWDLKRYKKNPVVLWHHNIFESGPWSFGGAVRPEDLLPIGKAENVKVTDGQLEARLVFASAELNPLADKIFRMFKEGMLKAVSVGFKPGKITEELKDGRKVYRLGDNELREISVVPIPSNPDAVAKSIAWEREHLGRMAANGTANAEENTMAMTDQEKQAFDAAIADAKSAKDRASTLETELKAEKAATERLEKELQAAGERATKAEQAVIESEITKLVGSKLTPAEKDEHIALAKEIGLERVQKILAARPDLKLLDPVKVDGKDVKTSEQPTPPPTDGAAGDGSADIVKAALNAPAN